MKRIETIVSIIDISGDNAGTEIASHDTSVNEGIEELADQYSDAFYYVHIHSIKTSTCNIADDLCVTTAITYSIKTKGV